ncbi:MAG: hypothetical protein H0T46_01465 [Deltaproteobacteria bacterium]|nr:hypothetical protein [Deltaproteobacteria bacterium]
MGTRTSAALVVVGLCAATHADAARRIPGWKDGCPTYFAPETARTRELPTRDVSNPNADDSPPLHEGATSFGVRSDQDSSMGPSRVSLDTRYRSLTELATLVTNRLIVHLNHTSGVTITGSYSTAHVRHITDNFFHAGNVQVYVGYRYTGYVLGDTIRQGLSLRVGGGSPFLADSNARDPEDQAQVEERNLTAALLPFEGQTFGFDRPVTTSAEWRMELIGCHAPFLHLRADLTYWRGQHVSGPSDPVEHPRMWEIPMSVSVGGFASPDWGFALAAGLEWRTPGDEWQGRSLVTRLSTTVEWRAFPGRFHFVLHGTIYTGDLTGWTAGLTLAPQFTMKDVFE